MQKLLKIKLISTVLAIQLSAYSGIVNNVNNIGNQVNKIENAWNSSMGIFNMATNSSVLNLMSGGGKIDFGQLLGAGNLPFELSCDVPDFDISLKIDNPFGDFCSNYGKLDLTKEYNSLVDSLTKGFSFGGCKVKAKDGMLSKASATLDLCKAGSNLPGGKVLFGNSSSQSVSHENMAFVGGDVYFKNKEASYSSRPNYGNLIKYGDMSKKEIEKTYLKPSLIAKNPAAGGNNAFWNPGDLHLFESCIKNAKKKNLDPNEVCTGEFYALPNSRLEAQEQVSLAAKDLLKDGNAELIKNVNNIEKTLAQSAHPSCEKVSNGECTDEAYVENVKKEIDKMVHTQKLDAKKNIEEEMANYQEHVKIATMPKHRITFPTQEVLDGLHPEKKREFVIQSNKQLHQDALFASKFQTLTELKKELVDISFRKAELSSKVFYPNAAIKEAQEIMKKGFED